ncbi:MAG: hypothetical protein NTX07_00360 [Solirubrobacterales bacterium]|nr:hypothetical protein [Solirubrobacterales bacterium]
MRIAIDIDSTLHQYWDIFSDVAQDRFGIALPYEGQRDWNIGVLKPEQMKAIITETHSDMNVLRAVPYPGAVETVRAWGEAGHWIHITSHRSDDAREATEQWLNQIGLPFDDLHCSFDKIPRCVELDIDLLVDDSPVNILRALEEGIKPATLLHPWNEDVCATEDVVVATDWAELSLALDPLLAVART